MGKNKIALFEGKKIRRLWDEEKEFWYFSVVDIIRCFNKSIRFPISQKLLEQA